jgi:hypothetical protein
VPPPPKSPLSFLTIICCCSATGRHPASSSTRRCCPDQLVRLRGLSPRPIPAGLVSSSEVHLRMSGDKACGKQAAQYTGMQPGEGSVVTNLSILPSSGLYTLVPTPGRKMLTAHAPTYFPVHDTSPLRTRGDARFPLSPLQQLWEQFPKTTVAGPGRPAGRSC